MIRKVGLFLVESWQLFYWSLFFPSKLQQRMDEWSIDNMTKEVQKNSSDSINLLLFNVKPHFVLQYFFVSVIMSLPLAGLISLSRQEEWDWLICLSAPLISYCLRAFSLPSGIGFFSPLLLALIYWEKPNIFAKVIQSLPLKWQPLPGLSPSFCIEILSISLFLYAAFRIFTSNDNHPFFSDINLLFGCGLTGILFYSGWINFFEFGKFFFVAVGFSGSLAFFVAFVMAFLIATNLAISMEDVLIFFVTTTIATIVAVIVAIAVAGIASSALYFFLIACALVAFGLSPIEEMWLDVWMSAWFISIGWEKLGFNAFWVIPVVSILYYRIFPDYLLAYLSGLFFTQSLQKSFLFKSTSLLTRFPPYTTELIWFPIPNHAQILADTFHQNTNLGSSTFQKMQAIKLPGFQLTIKKALPLIVADLLATINTTAELIDSMTPTYPLLPLLIPTSYQFDRNAKSLAIPKSGSSEIDNILFPILQQTAMDTAAALQGGSSALRERGLERLVDKLKMLPTQLPGLGLNPQAVKRWQPAIERWQHILELEIAEQQKTSQGELLNPFQFGNPLRPDRADIFKGRQDFADRLVRLILDRNRPTLVLHGPRRAGKTSFLLNLPRLLPSDLVPIYLDMQQGSMTASEGDFCYGLVRAIDRDTRSQGLQLPPIPSRQDFATQPYPTLEDWLDLALPKLGERRLLLNLDEFEKIGSAIKDGRISDRLFDQLRSMIQHYDRLGFLFSGVQTLEELGPRWSNYFISVVPMEIHYLEPHEAEDLLLNPDPEFTLQYDTGIVPEILHLTRCQPYLLQLIGSAIVNQANLQHTQLATTILLQTAIQDAFTNGEPYFTNIWTEFTGTTPAEVTAGQQILIALAQGNNLVETSDETTAARRRLLRYHVIERDGDIDKIEIPLFEQWVRERAIET
jgi:hypothetical protein